MQRIFAFVFAVLGWFAVVCQFYIMIGASTESAGETTARFLTHFTILTNILVAFYFTTAVFRSERLKPGTLTAVTLYISVVGLIYQVMLRSIWDPQGLQRVVDELLHSVIPLCTMAYWFLYEQKLSLKFNQIPAWLVYPFSYFILVILRGSFSGFYPYPFIDVDSLGYGKVAINAIVIFVIFVILAILFVTLGKKIASTKNT